MLGRVGLRGPVAHNLAVDERDTVDTKKALARLGHYSVPKWGVTPYPDTAMFEGVKSFQRSQGLAVDGRMSKDGPTARLLDGAIRPAVEDHLKSRVQARATSLMPKYDWAWKDGRLQRIQVDALWGVGARIFESRFSGWC